MPNAKLTVVVQTPTKYLSLFINVERVMVSAKHIYSSLCIHLFNMQSLLILISSFQHSSNLTTFWITPSVNKSSFCQKQSMVSSTNNLCYLFFLLCIELGRSNSSRLLDGLICGSSHRILRVRLRIYKERLTLYNPQQ